MRYAIIENGIVTNVVIADAELATQNGWIECPDAGPNWTYANGVFTAPIEAEPILPTEPTKEELLAQLQELTLKIQALA
jgi:hypothetical protein